MNNEELERELFQIIKQDEKPPLDDQPCGAGIDYEDPEQVKKLAAKHLAKIFMATHKEKLRKEIDKLKTICK